MAICSKCSKQYLETDLYPTSQCYQHGEDNPKVILHSREELLRQKKQRAATLDKITPEAIADLITFLKQRYPQ